VQRTERVPHPLAPTLDHIVPLARGGHHTRDNTQCAHFSCNTRKGARVPQQDAA
jgi:5-methylcytosine-specific restriction endonuclease McrA